MELELKHLCPYLPYGLKILWKNIEDGKVITIMDVDGRDNNSISIIDVIELGYKPILFDLSSLTKVIEVGGEKFVPDEMFDNEANGKGYHFELQNMARYKYCDGYLPYKVQIKLFEWKIDVNQLIPANLAISVDELPENPYK